MGVRMREIYLILLLSIFLIENIYGQDSILIDQENDPIKVQSVELNYSPGDRGFQVSLQLFNSSKKGIKGYEVSIQLVDVFNNLIGETFTGIVAENLNVGFGSNPTLSFDSNNLDLFPVYGRAYVTINRVRFNDKSEWSRNASFINEKLLSVGVNIVSTTEEMQLNKIYPSVTESDFIIESIILSQKESPVYFDSFNTNYEALRNSITINLNYYSLREFEIVAYEITLYQYDAIGDQIGMPYTTTFLTRLQYGVGKTNELKIDHSNKFEYMNGVIAIAITRVRYIDGTTWTADEEEIKSSLLLSKLKLED